MTKHTRQFTSDEEITISKLMISWCLVDREIDNVRHHLNLLFLTPHVYSSVIVSSMMNESMNMVGIIRMTKHLVDHYHHVLTGIVHQVYHEVHDSMVDC